MMINEGMKNMIENNALSFASCSNNNPHVIMVGDVKVVSKDELLIGDNYMKTTLSNIKENKNVGLAVSNGNKGYSIEGTAEYYDSGKYLKMVKEIHSGYPAKGAIVVKLNKIKVLS